MSKKRTKDHLVAIRLDAETFKSLKKESEADDISISSLIREAIRFRPVRVRNSRKEDEDGSV